MVDFHSPLPLPIYRSPTLILVNVKLDAIVNNQSPLGQFGKLNVWGPHTFAGARSSKFGASSRLDSYCTCYQEVM
jgi:hypothetical protein